MKQTGIIFLKECFHILRDGRTLLLLIGLPVVQILLFGFAITTDIVNTRIAILDPSRDPFSGEIQQRLLASGYFRLEEHSPDIASIERAFRENRIKMAVVFPEGLQEKLLRGDRPQIQLIADAGEPNTATTLVSYAEAILMDFALEKTGTELPRAGIRTEIRMQYNPEMKSAYLFVPGVMTIVLMLICAMMTSIAITREKERGTMELLLVSPVKPVFLILGKVAPYFILGMVIAAITLLLGLSVFDVPVRGSFGLLGAITVLFVLTSLGLGILISTRTDSQMVAMMLSMVALMLPGILLSGFIFPIASMPAALQFLSQAIPARWYLSALKSVMLKGAGIETIWREALVLAGMCTFILALGIKNFKIRLN
ncbi:MAG: hypothetical protein RL386_613 [Bacteroidota bacterium]|jgi:ABC-2 type transport system permease protein